MNLPFPVKVLYHTLFILHFYTHTLLSYLCSFGTICWHIRRFIFNTSNIFRIFTDSFLFINASKRHMSSPFTHLFKEESQPRVGASFLFYSTFFLLDCFSAFLVVFLLVCFFFFSVFVFFTGSGLSSSLFKLIWRSSFLKWAWLPIFLFAPGFP